MTGNRLIPLVTLVVVALACSSPPAPEESLEDRAPVASDEQLERVRAVAGTLGQQLAEHLFSELESSGPIAAIEVCSRVAQETAASLSRNDLSVRRVSLEVRNPADEPDAWERGKLVELARLAADNELPDELFSIEVAESGHELRYLKPIVIAPPCLTCHGDVATMDPELAQRLRDLYPQDRAVGYSLGDLRGAVSVRLSLAGGGDV